MTTESRKIAEQVMASEAMMWLVVGANHPEMWLEDLRKYYQLWKAAGGISYSDPATYEETIFGGT